jgi:hypothetical protein
VALLESQEASSVRESIFDMRMIALDPSPFCAALLFGSDECRSLIC